MMCNGGGDAGDAEKAAAAVSAVSGKQILKAIVDAAKGDGEKKGVKDVKEAKNPIEAAIGSTDDNDAAAFDKMKKNDQIAAAIVLRGMAKDGEFALKDNEHDKAEKGLKSTVESAVNKTVSEWLEEMVKAAKAAAGAANGDNTEIGKVVKVAAGAAAKGGDAKSVNGIAGGIKGIVEAAEKAGEEGKLESEAAGDVVRLTRMLGSCLLRRRIMVIMGVVLLLMQRRLLRRVLLVKLMGYKVL
ncbi:hypothetical protein CV666_06825 [Borreliella burgdorferi]|nr:hypothetical protein CV666_06825 [Borreliella burgdorferi]